MIYLNKKSPEQEYRRKKLIRRGRTNYYDGTVDHYEWGHGYETHVGENGKEYVRVCRTFGTGFKYWKKYGNRLTRQYKGVLKNGRHHLKIYNAKWEWW